MSAKDKICNKILDIRKKPYTPLFKAGDIILNKKYKIVRKVKEIYQSEPTPMGLDKNGVPQVMLGVSSYVLIDLANPLKQANALRFESMKYCTAIDAFYEKIDEQAAKILYGLK